MSTGSKIEWTDHTWNPVTGCDHVSPGCDNCYAERIATRFGRPFIGYVELHPERLEQPLHWRDPSRVFVNSVSDLFHPDVSADFIAQVFAVMSRATAHTFQVLTKRPQLMQRMLSMPDFRRAVDDHRGADAGDVAWPLPNVWLGVSVENQRYADLRIPHLLATPAAVRFLSAEPLLGPISLDRWLHLEWSEIGEMWIPEMIATVSGLPILIDWVIIGGESGPGARPMEAAWARELIDQCAAVEVPAFMKQAGAVLAREWGTRAPGTDPDHWPEAFRVREYPT